MKKQAQEYREKMYDQIVEQDDDVLAAYFEVSLCVLASAYVLTCSCASMSNVRQRTPVLQTVTDVAPQYQQLPSFTFCLENYTFVCARLRTQTCVKFYHALQSTLTVGVGLFALPA